MTKSELKKRNQEDMGILRTFLEGPDSKKHRLMERLGYKTTQTIRQWVLRKRLPRLRRDEILKWIEKV